MWVLGAALGLKGPPPTCAMATRHLNLRPGLEVRYLRPFRDPEGANSALEHLHLGGVQPAQVYNRTKIGAPPFLVGAFQWPPVKYEYLKKGGTPPTINAVTGHRGCIYRCKMHPLDDL